MASKLPETLEFDKQIYDALKSGTGSETHRIMKGVELPADYDLEGETSGLNDNTPVGFEAWRQLHLEY